MSQLQVNYWRLFTCALLTTGPPLPNILSADADTLGYFHPITPFGTPKNDSINIE